MRVIALTYEYRPFVGGIGTYVAELCAALQRAGVEVVLLAPDYGEKPSPETGTNAAPSADESQPYEVLRFRSGRGLGSWPRWFGNAARVGRDLRALRGEHLLLLDLHAILLYGAMSFVAPGAFPAERTAALFHGSEIHYLQTGRRARLLGRPVVDRLPRIFTNSAWTRGLLAARGEERWHAKSEVVGIGVAPRLLGPPASPEFLATLRVRWQVGERRVLLTVARLVPRKGIDRSLRAFATLPEAVRVGWCYLIAGDGPEREALSGLAADLGLGDSVRWLGAVHDADLPGLYDLADLYVQLSREVAGEVEGLGITFLEAGARGLASLACEHGGIPEAIVHGETGLLVPTEDAAAAGRALARLVADGEERARLGRAARARVAREFSWDAVARRVTALYASGAEG